MPAKSKAQFRFMEAIAHGGIKKPDLSPDKAKEFVQGQSYKALPDKVSKFSKIKKALGR